jgi:peptidoglycan L-alanyl-D-glutamate endopeptidase CwlK
MTVKSRATGTPAQLKQLVAHKRKHQDVSNQEVINYLAKGTTTEKAWVKAKSFGVDANRLVRGPNGENVRQQEFMPATANRRPPAGPTGPTNPTAPTAPTDPTAPTAPTPSTDDSIAGGTPADLQKNVADWSRKDTDDVVNQDVINYLLQGGRSYDDAAGVGQKFGVNLDDLARDRDSRDAPFETGAPVAAPTTDSGNQANADEIKDISESVADLTQKLPKDLRDKINANVLDIHKTAQNVYDRAIANGKTEDAACDARHKYVEGEIRKRGPKLDEDIGNLVKQGKLSADDAETYNDLKSHLGDADLYTKVVAAKDIFEKTSNSLDVIDKTYKTKNPDQVEPTPTAPITPDVAVSAQNLTAVEKNYIASLKQDPLFAKRLLGTAGFYNGPLSAQWDSKVEGAALEAIGKYREVRKQYGELDSRSEAAVITLHPTAQAAARQVVNQMNAQFAEEGNGQVAKILWGTRTYAQQNALFNQHNGVTNARGGQSNHNFGIAFDVGIFKGKAYLENNAPYKKAHDAVHVPGLGWGGNWQSLQDMPHYQLQIHGKDPNVREMRTLLESGKPLPVEQLPSPTA